MTLWFMSSDEENEVEIPDPLCAQYYYSNIWLKDRGVLILSDSEQELYQKVVSEDLNFKTKEYSASLRVKHLLNHAPLVASIHDSIQSCPPNSLLFFGSGAGHCKGVRPHNACIKFKSKFKEFQVDQDFFVSELMNEYKKKVEDKKTVHLFISAGFDSRLELALLTKACARNSELILHHFFEDEEASRIVRDIADALSLTLIMHKMKEKTEFGIGIQQIVESISASSNWRPTIPAYAGVVDEYLGKENSSEKEVFFGFTPYEFKGRYFELYGRYQGKRLRFIVNPESSADIQNEQLELQRQLLESYINCSPFHDDYRTIDFLNWSLSYTNSYSHRNRILGKMGLINIAAKSEYAELFFNLPRHIKERNHLVLEVIQYLSPTLHSIPFISSSGDAKDQKKNVRNSKTEISQSQTYIGILNNVLSTKLSTVDSEFDVRMLSDLKLSESQKFSYLQVEYFRAESMRAMQNPQSDTSKFTD